MCKGTTVESKALISFDKVKTQELMVLFLILVRLWKIPRKNSIIGELIKKTSILTLKS